MSAFWLSFADDDRPEGQQFLGACIIPEAADFLEAMTLAWVFGLNPGGQVAAVSFDNDDPLFAKWPRLKLISKAEFVQLERLN